MDSITLAVGKDASGNIHHGHFGDADLFAQITLLADGTLIPGPVVSNSSKSLDDTHGATGKMKSVLAALSPLHCVVSTRMSPNFKRMARESPIQPVVIRCADDSQLLPCLSRECARLMEWVDRRQQDDPMPGVPVLEATPGPDSPPPDCKPLYPPKKWKHL